VGGPHGGLGAGEELRLLHFRSAGERFTLEVSYVREIVPLPEVTPVPFVPDTVAGIINHRGTIYTLISFARLAGLGPDEPGTVVLLRLPEMAVGLAVTAVEGIERASGASLAPAPGAEAPTVPFLVRASDASGRLVHAIDAEVLIDTVYQLPELGRAGEG
jgi:purine-binding chemotaxis protein CheW